MLKHFVPTVKSVLLFLGLSASFLVHAGHISLSTPTGASSASPAAGDPTRNPVGEKANYDINKSEGRTSSMIRSGNAQIVIERLVPAETAAAAGDSYEMIVRFNVNLHLMGMKKGEEKILLPVEFYTAEFRQRLRDEKEVHTPQFSLKYLGVIDITTQEGQQYPHAERILIHNIKLSSQSPLQQLLVDIGKGQARARGISDLSSFADIEDLQFTIAISEDVPALGAAIVDIQGKMHGFNIKLGLDYAQ